MKKIIFSIFAFITLSCADQLELLPQQSLVGDVALSNDSNIKKVLLGGYDELSSGFFLGGNSQFFSELLGSDGEIRWNGTFTQPREIIGKAIDPTNTFVGEHWLDAYSAINVANNVISAVSKVNQEDQARVEGESLFIRAIAHFELVRFYGKDFSDGDPTLNPGVPLVLVPTSNINASEIFAERSSVAQVYTQVITDLIRAESLLPVSNDVFADKVAVAALLARVHLQKGDYANARDAANRAIQYNDHSLALTYSDVFNNSSDPSEYIFAFQVTPQDGTNNMHLYWSIRSFGGRGDVLIQQKHLDLYEAGDSRVDLFYSSGGAIRSGKWATQYSNLPVLRLAEMYLIRAESNFRLGTSLGATPLSDINTLRSRVGLADKASIALDDILKERKLELAHEGHLIHDIKRLGLTADGIDFTDNRMVFPIPRRELDANPGLSGQQNPGYGN
jgi:starch-binding outer membrane protein, SusD/RagB family